MRPVDQKREVLFRFLAQRGGLVAAQGSVQGSVQESYRVHKGRKLGPYFRLSFREAGKQRSCYIGRNRAFAAEIEKELQKLQAPRLFFRQVQRCLADCRRDHRIAQQELRRRLETHGLRLQGNEIRGWRRQRAFARAPAIRPARLGAVMGQGMIVVPPVPRAFLFENRANHWPRCLFGKRSTTCPTKREYRPQALVPERPDPWATNHAAFRKGFPDHAVY
jgi:hypothetical protein